MKKEIKIVFKHTDKFRNLTIGEEVDFKDEVLKSIDEVMRTMNLGDILEVVINPCQE